MLIFDRALVRLHRDRAASLLPGHDFLLREVASRLAERFDGEILRQFPIALIVGPLLADNMQGKAGIQTLIQSDLSENITRLSTPDSRLSLDEEFFPFAPSTLDLVLSNLTLHTTNDLPGALIQIQRTLKPGGLFIAAMFGGRTLHELRQAAMEAEPSPRVAPFVDVKDAGMLLQRAGFQLPVTDTETITVNYKDAFSLMRDLRGMGETNALLSRRKSFTSRTTLEKIAEIYTARFGQNGKIPATFEIVTLTGWKS